VWFRTVLVVTKVDHARVVLVLIVIRSRLIPCDPIRGSERAEKKRWGTAYRRKDLIADVGIAYCSLSFGS